MGRGSPDPPSDLGTVSNDAELVEAHRSLVGLYWRLGRSDNNGIASSHQHVFDPQERSSLALYKYVEGQENVSKQELRELLDLEALGLYCFKAPRIKLQIIPITGVLRFLHAHNALVSFRDRPFTLNEFAESYAALERGEDSLITIVPEASLRSGPLA